MNGCFCGNFSEVEPSFFMKSIVGRHHSRRPPIPTPTHECFLLSLGGTIHFRFGVPMAHRMQNACAFSDLVRERISLMSHHSKVTTKSSPHGILACPILESHVAVINESTNCQAERKQLSSMALISFFQSCSPYSPSTSLLRLSQ